MKKQISKLFILSMSVIILALVNYSCEPPTEAETTGDIQGVIYDASNSQPLSGATITTEPITSSKITDTNGSFLIEGIEPGDYSLQVTKTGYQTNTTTVKVIAGETASADLQLSPVEPQLSVSTTDLDFSSSSTSLPFTISNSGEGTLEWTVSENSNWISVNPASGSITTNQSSVTVSVDRSSLSAGDYSESISVSSNGGSATITVTMTVEGPVVTVSNNSLNFGMASENLTFNITNSGIGTVTYNIVYSASWLTVNPTSGSATTETDVINVNVNRNGLAYGNYFETMTVTSNSNSVTVDVMLTVPDPNNPQLSAYPTTLDFETTETNLSFYISNTGSGLLAWNITDDKTWISVNPQSGTTESEIDEITVTVDRLGQTPGTYTGTVTVSSDGGNQNINVSMSVPDEPSLSVSPTYLDFGSETTALSFDVANAGTGDLSWSVSDNQAWITESPTAGTNYGTVNVTVSRDGISPGDYSGTVTVSSNGGTDYVEISMNMPADEPPTAVTLTDPTNITVNSMTLLWSRNYDSDFAAYRLYYSTSPAVTENSTLAITITDNNTNSHTVTGLSSSTTYYVKVYVMDTAQMTTGSNVVSASTSAILGNWVLTDNIVGVTFYSVWFNSLNDGYAVGSSGQIYHWGGSNWVQEVVPDDALRLYDVRFIDANNGYAVGIGGTFLYYNGVSWSEFNSPTSSSIGAVFPLSNDNIWCYSYDEIHHWDGSEWTTTYLDIDTIYDIFFIDENDGWVLDKNGKMFHYNGIGWASHSDVENYSNSNGELYFLNSSEGWYTTNYQHSTSTDYNYVYHYDGSSWSLYEDDDYPINSVTRIQEVSASNVWAVGYDGLIFNFDGERWNSITSPTTDNIYGIFMISSSDGWAVGTNGVILRYH